MRTKHSVLDVFVVCSAIVVVMSCQSGEAHAPAREPAKSAPPASPVIAAKNDAATQAAVARTTAPAVAADKSAPAAASAPTSPEKLAEVWLDTLGTQDLAALTKLTRTPFVLHDPALPKRCASRTAREAAELPDTLGCELANKLLVEDVAGPFNRPHTGFLLDAKDTPSWAKRWQKEIGMGVVPIGIGLMGAGVFHEMVILAGPEGVHGFWRRASYESD